MQLRCFAPLATRVSLRITLHQMENPDSRSPYSGEGPAQLNHETFAKFWSETNVVKSMWIVEIWVQSLPA